MYKKTRDQTMQQASTEEENNEYLRQQERIAKDIKQFQGQHYGSRYVGASLSAIRFTDQKHEAQISQWLKNPKNFLVFHGAPGIGKTYFCSALTEWAFKTFRHKRYHREEDLLRRLRSCISAGQGDYLIQLEWLIDDQLVILDDVGSGINPDKLTYRDLEFRREVFFSFCDYRYRTQLPTVITSNFSRDDFIKVYSDRIVSRLFANENTIISNFNTEDDKRQQGL